MDYQANLFDPIYTTLGVAGVINGVEGFTVLDKTAGLEWGVKGPDVQTISCAAVVRAKELASLGVALGELENGSLEMNGTAWNIESYKYKPSPKGQGDGEIVLVLTEVMSEESE
jgi:hypothetical protein